MGKMTVMSVPCDKAFAVSSEKSEEFLKHKAEHNPIFDEPSFKEFCERIRKNSEI